MHCAKVLSYMMALIVLVSATFIYFFEDLEESGELARIFHVFLWCLVLGFANQEFSFKGFHQEYFGMIMSHLFVLVFVFSP